MIYLGIDPGMSGGIAALTELGEVLLAAKMPDTERDVYQLLSQLPMNRGYAPCPRHAVLERVWSSPGWGHVGSFKFGLSYGGLRMALTAACIPFDEVLPRAWQKELGCLSGKDKNITKRRAQALFPGLTITHATADALLMAEYCRRMRTRSYGSQEAEEGAAEVQSAEAGERPTPTFQSGRRGGKADTLRSEVAQKRLSDAARGRSVASAPRHGAGPQHPAR